MKRSAAPWMIVVLLVALGVRLGAAAWWQSRMGDRFFFGDSHGYWVLGRAIAHGGPYEYGSPDAGVFRAPAYPLVLAPLFWLGGDEPPIFWARILGAVLGTAAVGGVGWIASRLYGPWAGVTAAAIAAIEPGAVAMSVMVLSEALFCPLMVLHLALWIAASFSPEPTATASVARALGEGLPTSPIGRPKVSRSPGDLRSEECGVGRPAHSARTVWLSISAGLASGAAVLARPSWLLFTPVAVLVGVAISREHKRQFMVGACMLLGLAIAMTPWWIRNYLAIGRFVPTTLQVGTSLYDGLNPQATGASDLSFVERFTREERARAVAERADAEPLEYRLDRRLAREAMGWARENPGRVLQLAAVKFMRIWNFWPNEAGLSAWPLRLAIVLTYVPIMVLAVAGTARTIRGGWPYVLCWLPAVYFTALHIVFVGSIRYRVPAMLLLAVLAAGAVIKEEERERGRRGELNHGGL